MFIRKKDFTAIEAIRYISSIMPTDTAKAHYNLAMINLLSRYILGQANRDYVMDRLMDIDIIITD